MPYRFWSDNPGERRCVNCDQRLVTANGTQTLSAPDEAALTGSEPPETVLNYVCPDNHERWAYNSQSREWRQMY